MELKNKVALVLGAVKGIGKGIGLALAREEAKVALNYFDWEEELEDLGSEKVWLDHPMGWQILGDRETLNKATISGMKHYLDDILNPAGILVVATGKVDHQVLAGDEPVQAFRRHPLELAVEAIRYAAGLGMKKGALREALS